MAPPELPGCVEEAPFETLIVAGQVALSAVLLTSAGLLIHSLVQAMMTHAGVEPKDRITFRVSLSGPRHSSNAAKVRFIDDVITRLQQLPGVAAAGMTTSLPVGDDGLRTRNLVVEGGTPIQGGTPPEVGYRIASPGFFRSEGIPITSGRAFEESDTRDRLNVVIVNQTAARRFWPNQNPIGRRVRFETLPWSRVVGVSGDVRYGGIETAPRAEVFLAHAQADYGVADEDIAFVVHARTNLESLSSGVVRTVASVDPEQPVYGLMTMSDVIGRATAARRLSTWVLAILAILGLVLALLGIYGTTSNAVAQRTREIAVRMALGANQFEVLRSCMLSALRSTVLGLTIGICSTPLIAQLFAKLLYGTSPLQSGVYALVSGLICMASLVAAYRPASRASRIDPIEALRWE